MSSNDDGFADSIFSHRKRMETISEIVEGEIYLSSLLAATQAAESINKKGITHIVSILKEPFQRHANVEYLVVGEDDMTDTDLQKHFPSINAFMDDAKSKGGATLLHCQSGVSRSATAVIAYLMHSRGMGATQAYEFVKKRRVSINPNLSFVRQLQEYDEVLRTEGIITNSTAGDSSSNGAQDTQPFLVHYLRATIPTFTQNLSDDQLIMTAKRCDYNYIQVLASLRQQANTPTSP